MSCLSVGRVTQAVQVDHVFPWSYLGKDAFFNNIFQTLCTPCHSHKTALEAKNIMRFYNKNKVIDYRLNEYAFVIKQLLEN
jgi:5-methylcytosine-specific restriction endonuclease McrA